jgi:hypothetical protein
MTAALTGRLALFVVALVVVLSEAGCAVGPPSLASHGVDYTPSFYSPEMRGEGGG